MFGSHDFRNPSGSPDLLFRRVSPVLRTPDDRIKTAKVLFASSSPAPDVLPLLCPSPAIPSAKAFVQGRQRIMQLACQLHKLVRPPRAQYARRENKYNKGNGQWDFWRESHDRFLAVDRGGVGRPGAGGRCGCPEGGGPRPGPPARLPKAGETSGRGKEAHRAGAAGVGLVADGHRGHVLGGEGAAGPHPAGAATGGGGRRPPRPRRSRSTAPA